MEPGHSGHPMVDALWHVVMAIMTEPGTVPLIQGQYKLYSRFLLLLLNE